MICVTENLAAKRYLHRVAFNMTLYVLFLVAAVFTFSRYHPKGPSAYILALLPAAPVMGIIAVVGLYLREEQDEFLKHVLTQSMIWSIGITLALETGWGFLETFAHTPHVQLFLIFPLFWAFVGIFTSFLKRRYR